MSKKRIFFRADASASIGYGHFIRTLALADMLKENFDCTFFTQTPSAYQQGEVEKVCRIISLPSDDSKFERFLEYLTGEEIVVLDNYFYSSNYQLQIKLKGCKLVCVDDMHDKHYYADVVINHGLSASVSDYSAESYTQFCLGSQWTLIRKAFLACHTEKVPGCWFISFGGSDFYNLTEKYIQLIHDDADVREISIVVGDAYKYTEDLMKYPKARIYSRLSAVEMATLMQKAEYAIVPASSVFMEALASGCKICTGYFVDNQAGSIEDIKKDCLAYVIGNLCTAQPEDIVDTLSTFPFNNHVDYSRVELNYKFLFKRLEI